MPREYNGRKLLTWMMGNADRPVNIEEMAEAVGWTAQSCSTAVSHMIRSGDFPQLRRVRRGTYVWDSAPKSDEDEPVKELLLRVIKHRGDGAMLAENIDNSDQLYVVTPFEF